MAEMAALVEDTHYMRLALSVAELGRSQTTPNPLVGAVLVKDGEVVGQGAHLKPGGPHAEIHALRMAGEKAEGATAYVTLEPCSHYGRTPPCADALIKAGVKRVVVAMEDPDPRVQGQGVAKLRSAGMDVTTGVLALEAGKLNEAYLKLKETGRPFVTWKCAATLDGRIATQNGHSSYVTGPESRRTVHELRRRIPVIAVGIQTVLADDPRLTVRLDGEVESNRQPLRVVFDSKLRMPTAAAMLREPGKTLIYTTEEAVRKEQEKYTLLQQHEVEITALPADEYGRVSLEAALKHLGQLGYDELLLEGGATLAGAFLKRQWIDKVVYYIAPKFLGGGLPALTGLELSTMSEAVLLQDVTWSQVGTDFRLEGYPMYPQESVESKGD